MAKNRFLVQIMLSILCLVGGSLVAISLQGVLYGVFAGLGFGGYLFFFGRALREIPFPRLTWEGDPDPEQRQGDETEATSARTVHQTAA